MVLLAVEIVADKVPALDSVNDTVQTFVRPASGGIVFGSGTAAQTAAVADPGEWARSGGWIPVVIGVVIALVVSLTKTAVRPPTWRPPVAAPVLSTIEDVTSFGLVFVALLVLLLVLVILAALIWSGWRLWRRIKHRKDAPYAAHRRAGRLAGAAPRAALTDGLGQIQMPLPTATTPPALTENVPRSFSMSTPTISPGPTTTFLSRIARRTTAPRPTRTPGISTLPSTIAPSSMATLDDSTELRTEAAEMMLPALTTDSLRRAAVDELGRRQVLRAAADRPAPVVQVEDGVHRHQIHVGVVERVERSDVTPVAVVAFWWRRAPGCC